MHFYHHCEEAIPRANLVGLAHEAQEVSHGLGARKTLG